MKDFPRKMINFELYKDKRILITGHTGFKGSWLVRILQLAGAEVSGVALPPETGSHFELLGFDAIDSLSDYFDIRDFPRLFETVKKFDPHLIFHLAAQPLVRESFEKTRETYEVNFMGGVNLLECLREQRSLQGVIFITSDKAYENVEWPWGYRETDPIGGIDPYSASKGSVEIAVSSYRRSIFDGSFYLGTVRAGNVIGGGDWSKDRIVPDIVRSIEADSKVTLRNPSATRPWQHVLEPLSGYLLLGDQVLRGQSGLATAYNFGPMPSIPKTVLQVAEGLIHHIGRGRVELEPDTSGKHEAGLLQLNIDLAMSNLAWQPRWSFDATIERTALWYKAHLEHADIAQVTDAQIYEYFSELKK